MQLRHFIGVACAGAALLAAASSHAANAPEQDLVAAYKTGAYSKIGPWLGNLYDESRRGGGATFTSRNPALKVAGGYVGIDAVADDPAALQADLARLGATDVVAVGPLVSARVPVRALGDLAALPSLAFAEPMLARARATTQGTVVSQGDRSLNAPAARALGTTGGGVKVGVLSDSFGCNPPAFVPGAPTTTLAQDVASGDLPADTVVVKDACPGNTDEGRAMAQLVHDVAPDAGIRFRTAFVSELDFALGIRELANGDSNVIVDDIIYFAEPMFIDGPVAQEAGYAFSRGRPYFSSAGNDARLSYESDFRPTERCSNAGRNLNSPAGGPNCTIRHDFDPGTGVSDLQKVRVTKSGDAGVVLFSFQWDQPSIKATAYARARAGLPTAGAPAATGDLDLVIYDSKGILVPFCPPGVATGITCQLTGNRNIGGNAIDVAALVYSGNAPAEDFYVGFVLQAGEAPTHVKYVAFELQGTFDIVDFDTASGTAFGHSNGPNVAAVGASAFYFTPAFDTDPVKLLAIPAGTCAPFACLNDFSSAGGVPVYFDRFGTRLGSPLVRQVPWVTGPDGGNTTFFFADSSFDDDDGDGANSPTSTFLTPTLDSPADEKPNFFGTSASAPHVAGVAALMLGRNRGLAPQAVYDILRESAVDMRLRELSVIPVRLGPSTFSPLPVGYDFDSGYGLVDAARAVQLTPSGP